MALPMNLSSETLERIERERQPEDRRPLAEILLDHYPTESNQLMRRFIARLREQAPPGTPGLPRPIDIPSSVNLLKMKRVEDLDPLNILKNWARTREGAEWPGVQVGEGAGDEPTRLVFDAQKSGIHGMIAGTTGSGKSELLLTLICDLAINYDPSAINFLLVDFKGGAAFEEFRHLPHTIDVVTNLDRSAVARVFASIQAELDRRGRIIAQNRVKHIVDYRRRGYHKTIEPFPHLFIIIDEFAEMIQGDNAVYKAQLESITRLGRAIGVSLILATQKPGGVISDQMRANIKWKICLRVEGREDSQELLRRPDAAYLPVDKPGRAYLQIGNDTPELIQVAQAGANYERISDDPDLVAALERNEDEEAAERDEGLTISNALVKYMDYLQRKHAAEVAEQRKSWPDALPKYLPLDAPFDPFYVPEDEHTPLTDLSAGLGRPFPLLNGAVARWRAGEAAWLPDIWRQSGHILQATMGVMDHPSRGRQHLVRLDLMRGHVAIFGAVGWGKTTFLRTLALSLTATHSPRDLHIYILDFGGRALQSLEALPHVGSVILADDNERIARLFRTLNKQLEARKALIQTRADDIVAYNADQRGPHVPAMLVMINNFDEIKENYDGLIPPLIALLREGRNVGLHFTVAASNSSAMNAKVFTLFGTRMTLQQTTPDEYMNLVGRGAPILREVQGRGLITVPRDLHTAPLEFQVAAPLGLTEQEIAESREQHRNLNDNRPLADLLLDRLSSKLSALVLEWAAKLAASLPADAPDLPLTIDRLPTYIDYEPLYASLPPERQSGPGVVLGIEDDELQPFALQLTEMPHFLVVGPPRSGKTALLQTWIAGLAAGTDPNRAAMVLVDPRRRLFTDGECYDLGRLPHVLATISEPEQIEPLVQNLFAEFENQPRQLYIFIDNYDDLSLIGFDRYLRDLSVLARNHERNGLHIIIARPDSRMSGGGDALLKQVFQMYRYGLGLQSDSAVEALEVDPRLYRQVRQAELPAGRGFIVRSGRPQLVQAATLIPQDRQNEAN
ncbi:MAG: hypothetical protein HC915_11820, partial [Anaerolineae bacterium]|nr:hypothetical protein [Anaerolineae bacterium]